MTYLARLHALKAEKRLMGKLTELPKPGFVGFGSYSDRHFSGNCAVPDLAASPRQWQIELARLDAASPPDGFTAQRWRELVEDARWLANRHGQSAAALGWTASDLFGLDATHDGWGGLADRLAGARRVTFTDTVARWRSDTLDGWLWRKTLRPMVPVWDW